MATCICGESALELMRASGRLAPDLLDKRRASKLDGCGLPPRAFTQEDFERLGVKTPPYHILVPNDSGDRQRDDIVCHRHAGDLPMKSLIYVTDSTLVTSPALTFLQLAMVRRQRGSKPLSMRGRKQPRLQRPRDIEDLALIGLELCGTYLLDNSWDGLTNTGKPLTSVAKIERVLDAQRNAAGVAVAREALALVQDGSNSPMESILFALLVWPRRLGGYGLGSAELNYHVKIDKQDRYIDIAFPEARVGLEYKGREFHSIEKTGRDDRRQNELVGLGWTIINVWYEDLAEEHLYDKLVKEVARAMGIRMRVRSDSFLARRALLRARLLPSIRQFG